MNNFKKNIYRTRQDTGYLLSLNPSTSATLACTLGMGQMEALYSECTTPVIGCHIYLDEDMTMPVVNNFYSDLTVAYEVTGGMGEITSITTCVTPPPTGNVTIYNNNAPGIVIFDITIDGVQIELDTVSYPIAGGTVTTGTYNIPVTTSSTIIVTSNNAADAPVNISTNLGNVVCQLSDGYTEFTGFDLSGSASLVITLDVEGAACE
jgi:hypothetical protein